MAYNVCGNLKLNKIKVEITKIMNSTEILNEIKNQLEQLEHKGYDKNSFKSGFLLGYAKAVQLQQPDVIKSVCGSLPTEEQRTL